MVKKSIEDINDIESVAKALFDNKICHFGKDATVLGIAPVTDKENYNIVPLIISSSCKSETGHELADWVRIGLKTYHESPSGAKLHGDIRTLATDGESSFCKLRFELCLTEDLDHNSKLGHLLYQLPGLNCWTGTNRLIGTCDPKHVVKRFATMMRSPAGVQLATQHLTSNDSMITLQQIMEPKEAASLLNPADKQNVPKAVNLIESLLVAGGKKVTIIPNQSIKERIESIGFIAKVLNFFLNPFINVEMTLSQQLCELSTYTHLVTGLYQKHQLGFLTSALLANSQQLSRIF